MAFFKAFIILALLIISFSTVAMAADVKAINVKIGENNFSAMLEDNATAKAFAAKMPVTLEMSELNGNEKYYYLENSLPSEPRKIGEIHAGDIMLYGDNCVVIFYKSFMTSYRYTRIGRIELKNYNLNLNSNLNYNLTERLEKALGKNSVSVTFSPVN